MEKIERKVKALSLGRIEEGSIGFLTTDPDEDGLWRNIAGETEVLKTMAKDVLAKGNRIQFEYNNGVVGSITLIEKAKKEEGNWADDMTNFEDLLNAAHKKFKDRMNIKTELISMDYESKQALFSACVSLEDWEKNEDNMLERRIRVFTGHGDAEGITNDKIQPHFIRMAETRAIARALRFATNNAKVAVEETSGKE